MNNCTFDDFTPSDVRIRIQSLDDIIEMFRWFVSDLLADEEERKSCSFEAMFSRFCREIITENAVLDAVQQSMTSFRDAFNEVTENEEEEEEGERTEVTVE